MKTSALSSPLARRVGALIATPALAALWIVASESFARTVADDGRTLGMTGLGYRYLGHGLVVAAATMVWGIIAGAAGTLPRYFRLSAFAVLLGAVAAWPAWQLALSLTSGDWIARQAYASVLRWGIAGAAVAMFAALGIVVARAGGRRAVVLALLVVALATLVADAVVFPGLYPVAHGFLYGSAVMLTVPSAHRVALGGPRRLPLPLLGVFGLASIAMVGLGPLALSNWRGSVVRASPALGRTFAYVAPPPAGRYIEKALALDDVAAREPPDHLPLGSKPQSVILVVVDTLRADALPPVRPTEGDHYATQADTPNLDRWLASAYRFSSAYSQASQTKGSMPPMFRSLEPFEDPSRTGRPLAEVVRDAGLRPVALVPQYFIMPAQRRSQELLIGFDRVEVYEKDRQETMGRQLKLLLSEVQDVPFFAWVHFYNMHVPYFAGRQLGRSDGDQREQYRTALRWLDVQFGALVAALKELELESKTLVVLTADHGEHLGENRMRGHGDGVHDVEVHVPFAWSIPGAQGGLVEAVVGNIDVVPTIMDLLRAAPARSHRGRSLVPLMQTLADTSPRAYYTVSGTGRIHGLVRQNDKLVFDVKNGTFSRFHRTRDPHDRTDLFGEDTYVDDRAVGTFVRRNPGQFASELANGETLSAVRSGLAAAGASSSPSQLALLARLALLSKHRDIKESLLSLFDRLGVTDVERRTIVATAAFGTDPKRWGKRLESWLQELSGTPHEREALRALASEGQSAFSHPFVARQIASAESGKGSSLEPWLLLTARWTDKPLNHYGATLLRQLQAASTVAIRRYVLENIAGIRVPRRARGHGVARELETAVLPHLSSDDALIAVAAANALQAVGSQASVQELTLVVRESREPRIRQAAMHALAGLAGRDALPAILQQGKDPVLVADVIQLLGQLRDPRAAPFLEDVVEHHYNAWTRGQAKKALKAVRRRGKR